MNAHEEAVLEVVVSTLGIEDRAALIGPETRLLNGIPELDSMALVDLVVALEERFAIVIQDDDITGETFETLGTLTGVISTRLQDPAPRTS